MEAQRPRPVRSLAPHVHGTRVGGVAGRGEGNRGTEEPLEPPSLPVLAPEIEKTAHELKSGLGFRILRGLPVRELGKDGVAPAFMALSRQIGTPMEQPVGVKLAHVRAEPQGKGKGRYGFRATAELPFHTDLEDVIGFLCVSVASQGGTGKFASAATVYNVMREEHPDHLRALTRPFHMALHRPHPDHGTPAHDRARKRAWE